MKKLFISVLIGLFAMALLPQMTQAQFGKNMVMYRHIQWKIFESEHFEIYFDVPDWKNLTENQQKLYLAEMKNYLETAYSQISQAIHYEMPINKDKKTGHSKPKIFFFWSRNEATNHPLGPGDAIAYAEPLQLRLICVSREFPPEKIQEIVTHEVCHLFQFSLWNLAEKSYTQLARIWQRLLTFVFEGLSQHASGLHRTTPNAQIIVNYFLYYRVLNFLDVKDWIRFHNAYEVAYVLAGYLFDYINEHYGKNTFETFVKEFRREKPTAQAFEKAIFRVLNTDFTELDRNFKKYLQSQCIIPADAKEAYEYGRDILAERTLKDKKRGSIYEPVVSPSGEMIAGFIVKNDSVRVALLSIFDASLIKELSGGYSLYKYGLYPIVSLEGPGRALCFSPDGDSVLYFAQTVGKHPTLIKINIVTGKVKKDIKEEYETTRKVGSRDPATGIYEETEIPSVESKTVGTTLVTKLLEKKVNKIEIELDDPQSPEISRDGKTVIFSAIKNGQRDIFSLNLETREVKNLTNDESWDYAPSFSPDEKTIVYVVSVANYYKLFFLDLVAQEKKQLTFGLSNEIRPIYSKDGKAIFFISDQGRSKIKNTYSLDIESRKITQWTNVINSVWTVVPLEKNRMLMGAIGYRNSQHPFDVNVYVVDLNKIEPVGSANNLFESKEIETPEKAQIKVDEIDLTKIRKYSTKFYLDQGIFYGGLDTRYGIYGYGYLSWSDLTATRYIQVSIMKFGEYYTDNAFAYFDLSRRLWWGVVATSEDHWFYPWYTNEWYSLYGQPHFDEVLYNIRLNQKKISTIFQYPLDMCHRLEFSLTGTSIKYTSYMDWQGGVDWFNEELRNPLYYLDWWMYCGGTLEEYLQYVGSLKEYYELRRDFLKKYLNNGKFASFRLGFARDTTLYKQFGPFVNDMYRFDFSWSTGGHNITLSAEGRKYFRLGKEWVFALRGFAETQWGKTITPRVVGDLGELRGYQWMQLMGSRILLANLELRFPLSKDFNLCGIYLGDIRAALFCDLCKIGFDEKRFDALNADDVNTGTIKGSAGIDLTLGTVPILGMPLHVSFAKRMTEVKLFPKFENKWQVKFYLGYSF